MDKEIIFEIENIINDKIKDQSTKDNIIKLVQKTIDKKLDIEGLKFYLDDVINLPKEDTDTIISKLEFSKLLYKKLLWSQLKDKLIYSNKIISIIIPTYNRKNMILDSIESVLNQTYKNFEIIIVDDSSNDGTENLIKDKYKGEKRIKYYKNSENIGPGKSAKRGYDLSIGDFIIFMNDDDFYIDNSYFNKCINLYLTYENISLIASDTIVYYQQTKKISVRELNLPLKIDNQTYFLQLGLPSYPKPPTMLSVMYKRENLEYVGINEIEEIGDLDIYQRALLGNPALSLGNIVAVYRMHSSNISKKFNIDTFIKSLDTLIETKSLAFKKFEYDENSLDETFTRIFNYSISWYINSCIPNIEYRQKLLKWITENNIKLSSSNQKKL